MPAAPHGPDEDSDRIPDPTLAQIVEMASDAVIAVDEEHRIVLFNRGAEAIFGWSSEEILGRPLHLLLPARHRDLHREHMSGFAKGPIASRAMGERREIAGLRRDGREFPAEASLVRTSHGGGVTLTVLLRDVSERHRREERQRFLLEMGQVLFQSLDLAETLSSFGTKTVETLADHCLVGVNGTDGLPKQRHWSHGAGADPAFVHTLLASDPPDESGTWANLVGNPETPRLLQGEPLGPGASALIVPLRTPARAVGVAVLIREPTRPAFDSEALELAGDLGLHAGMALENSRLFQEVGEAVRARDDVLGVVSHDLGNPLQAIFIGLDALERAARGSDNGMGPTSSASPGPGYYLSTIRRSAELMDRLIRELMDFRRAGTGQLVLRRAPISLETLLDHAISVMEPLAQAKSVTLLREGYPVPDQEVLVDRDRLLQVFSNLIGNAVEHTERGGRIVVQARRRKREVVISVRDEGPGIHPDHLARVFERFWRAKDTERRGAGLGLAIARSIVDAHGGQIWAESEVGRGSTFHFSLPCPAS